MVSKHNDARRPRSGETAKDLAGDVKARILDAAQRVFLEQGYPKRKSRRDRGDGAGEQADDLCAYFAGKPAALFEAVVSRVIDGLTDFDGFRPKGRTVRRPSSQALAAKS
jgi:hypothetical protein